MMSLIPWAQWARAIERGQGEFYTETIAGQDVLAITSAEGLSALITSPRLPVRPGERYRLAVDIDASQAALSSQHTIGYVYALTITHREVAGRFFPALRAEGQPVGDNWQRYIIEFQAPTNARHVQGCCAFGNVWPWRRMELLTGTLRFRQPTLEYIGMGANPVPAPHQVPSPVGEALQLAANVLHNCSLPGRFYVSDGYSLSTNIVPDLSFGLMGATCLAHRPYLDLFAQQLQHEFLPHQTPAGKLPQRVMAQVHVPMWVYLLYHCTGDQQLVAELLDMAERSMAYMLSQADADGIPSLVDYSERRMGGGADWVDWDDQRLSGSTMVFVTWYWEALRWMAALERALGRADLAQTFAQRAQDVRAAINRIYWNSDHYYDNKTVSGEMVDARWADSQIWPVVYGLADATQADTILRHIDAQGARDEGFPTRWCETDIVSGEWGSMTLWRRACSWFGRLGSGDILARYRAGESDHGYALLRRAAEVFTRDQEIYEHYNMNGIWEPGKDCGMGNYLEHAGGLLWAATQGPLGISRLPVEGYPALTIAPRLPAVWEYATTQVLYLGAAIQYTCENQRQGGALTLSADRPVSVHVELPGQSRILANLTPTPCTWRWW